MFGMKRSVSAGKFLVLTGFVWLLMAGTYPPASVNASSNNNVVNPIKPIAAVSPVMAVASALYDSMELDAVGLSKQAFEFAYKGYQQLLQKGRLKKASILSICDFSQSSRNKRLYIIDVDSMRLLKNTYVAHGRNSGGEFANAFSNRAESHMSSLGFYVTQETYSGAHGLSLKIDGLEYGINDKANRRKIVIHGSDYISPDFIQYNKYGGRSYGCPAIPEDEAPAIINTIKNGTCLFIYHPTKKYIKQSKILNG